MISRTIWFLKQLSVVILVLGFCLSVVSCNEEPPLKIGFVGGLTGRVADLGVAGRDGVLLAVEEKNQSGGIAGRKVELIVKDDRQDAGSAKQVIRELIKEDVVAIIGPMTSSMAVATQSLVNADRIVTVSPTATTDQLSGQDDYFMRVTAPLSNKAEKLAEHVANKLNLKNIAVISDVSNRAYTGAWLNYFTSALQENGGQISLVEEFTSQPNVHFLPIAKRILKTEPNGILLLSNAIDTALLSQQIRKLKSAAVLFSTEWAFTTDLISFGGRTVNGMTTFLSFNTDSQKVRYLAFKERFTKRFGYIPSFATVLAYDAASFLFAGLEKNPSRSNLKETLLNLGQFPGLQSNITVDKYGDVEREAFMTVIENGQFRVVE
jgi:branched-chain amino acid transport system substrate-binding protein